MNYLDNCNQNLDTEQILLFNTRFNYIHLDPSSNLLVKHEKVKNL